MRNHLLNTALHIRRAPYQAIAAIGVMTMTLFLAAIISTIALSSQVLLHYFETRPQVTAFLKDDASSSQIKEIEDKVKDSDLASDIKLITKEDALAIYHEEFKNDPLLLEMVTSNILPASIEVSAKDPRNLKQITDLVKGMSGVDEVGYLEKVVSTLEKWTYSVRLMGVIMVSCFAAITLINIVVIINMKIAMKKEEIETMYLLGASKWHIRIPFLLEGIFYGTVGGILAWIFSVISIIYSIPLLVTLPAGLPLLPIPLWFYMALLAGTLVCGLGLGLFASLLAVKRYLK